MNNNIVSKIWVGMASINIHLLQFEIQSHLQKNADFDPVHQNQYRSLETV